MVAESMGEPSANAQQAFDELVSVIRGVYPRGTTEPVQRVPLHVERATPAGQMNLSDQTKVATDHRGIPLDELRRAAKGRTQSEIMVEKCGGGCVRPKGHSGGCYAPISEETSASTGRGVPNA